MIIRLSKGDGNRLSDLSVIILGMLIVILEVPYISRNIPNAIIIVLMVVFVFLNIRYFYYLSRYQRITIGLTIVYIAMQLMYSFLGISTAQPYYYFNHVQFYFFLVAAIMALDRMTESQIKIIIRTILLSVLIVVLENIVTFLRNGNRYVTMFLTEKYSSNVVDTQFVNSLLITIGALLAYCFMKGKYRNLAVLLSLFFFYFGAFVAQRTIFLIVSAIQFICLISFRKDRNVYAFLFSLAMILLIVLFFLNINSILNFLAENISSDRVSRRIQQINRAVFTESMSTAGGSLSARIRLIETSLNTFVSSFNTILFGAGDHRANNLIIGNHSAVFDELARYGIIGGGLCFILLRRSIKFIHQFSTYNNPRMKTMCNIIILILVLRCFIGGIFNASIGIQLFFFLPLFFRAYQFENKASII